MRYVWLALLPLLACAKTAIWDNPGWENPVEVIIETSSDGQSWTVAGCQPDGQSLSVTVPDANYYRAQAIERGTAATGDCDVANAAAISAYSNVFADIAELLPYSAVTVAPVLPWATEQEPPVMAQPTVGATVSSGTDSNSPWSALPHTVDAGTNLLVVAVIGWNDPGDYMINGNNNAVSSATWTQDGESGQAMTALVAPTIGGWLYQGAREAVGYFVLANPNIGEGDIAFGSGQTPQEGVTFVAVNLKNVDLAVGSAGIRDSESNSNEGSATSAAVSSSVDDLVVAALYSYNENTITWTAGGTSLHSATFNSATANVRVFDGAETSKTISASATDYPALFVLSIAGAAGGGTDDLTGDDLVAGTPTLDTPTLGQTHVLSGSDLSASAPVLDSPALGQVHGLSATDLAAGTPVLDTPALSETSALTGDDLTAGTPALDSPAIGQIHALSGADLASGTPALDSPTLGQTHALSGTDLSASAPVLDSPALGQTHALSATDLTAGTPTLDTPVLAEGSHALTANDLSAGTPVLDSPAIGQVHALSATDLVSGTPVLDSPSIGQIHGLTGSDLTAGTPTLDTPVLAEGNHVLTGDDLIAGTPTLDTPAFGQIHALTGSDLAAGNPLLDSPVFGQIHALSATDLASGTPVLDTPALSEATALTGSNLTAGTPVLDSPTIAQIHVLIPDDLITGAPTLTGAELGQIHGLLGNDLVAGTPTLDTPALGEAGGLLIYTATVGTSTGTGASASGSSGWAAN